MTGAQGPQGIPGPTPVIRNGNWWIWDNTLLEYIDSGVSATGPQGPQGEPGQAAQGVFDSTTITDEVVTFNAPAELPLISALAEIAPVQAGTGTPSPSNVRMLSGLTGCTIYHSDSDTENPNLITITFPTPPGDVYEGYVDLINKKLVITHFLVEWDVSVERFILPNGVQRSLSFNNDNKIAYFSIADGGFEIDAPGLCSYGTQKTNIWSTTDEGWCFRSGNPPRIAFRFTDIPVWGTGGTSSESQLILKQYFAEQAALGNKLQFLLKLLAPVEYDLTDIPDIITFNGENNIWANCGNMTVTYGAYLQSVYNNLNNKINALNALVLENNGG